MKFRSIVRRFTPNDSGATALEYGLLAGLIAVMVIAGASGAGTALNTLFTNVGTKLSTIADKAV